MRAGSSERARRSASRRNEIFIAGASASSPLMYCSKAATGGWLVAALVVPRGRSLRETTGDSAVHVEQIGERPGLDDLGRDLPGLEQNRPRAYGDRVAADVARADDHARRADDLTHANDRRMTEVGDGGHAKRLECAKPLVARHRGDAERDEVVGQDDRRRLPQPVAAGVAPLDYRKARRSPTDAPPAPARSERPQSTARREAGADEGHRERGRRDRRGRPRAESRGTTSARREAPGHETAPGAPVGRTTTDIVHCAAPVARQRSVMTSASSSKRCIKRRNADA